MRIRNTYAASFIVFTLVMAIIARFVLWARYSAGLGRKRGPFVLGSGLARCPWVKSTPVRYQKKTQYKFFLTSLIEVKSRKSSCGLNSRPERVRPCLAAQLTAARASL